MTSEVYTMPEEESSNSLESTEIPGTTSTTYGPKISDDEREGVGHLSQLSLAQSFGRCWRGHYAYDKTANVWRQFMFGTWKDADVIEAVADHVSELMDSGSASEQKAWLTLGNFKAIAELCQTTLGADFDANPSFLGYPGGYLLDTKTAEMERTTWRNYIYRQLPAGIGGDMNEPSHLWENFIFECLSHYDLADRYAIRNYLQEYAGSALTGECHDEAMLFLYGKSGSGKSTFVETLIACLGDYAASVQGSRVAQESGQHLQWLAGLEGKRLVAIHEVKDNAKWQSDTLNQLVSGGIVEANRMRQDSFNYTSTAHVVATGNHRPRAAGSSGIWRRLRMVHFRNQPATPDTELKRKLMADLPGVFAWCLEGLDRWIANGRKLDTPAIMLADTEAYRADADPVMQWADDATYLADDASVTVADLYAAFETWHIENVGAKVMTKRGFGNRLDELGYPPATTDGRVRTRHGMALHNAT